MSPTVSYLFRSLGSVVGLSVGTTLTQATLRKRLHERLSGADVDEVRIACQFRILCRYRCLNFDTLHTDRETRQRIFGLLERTQAVGPRKSRSVVSGRHTVRAVVRGCDHAVDAVYIDFCQGKVIDSLKIPAYTHIDICHRLDFWLGIHPILSSIWVRFECPGQRKYLPQFHEWRQCGVCSFYCSCDSWIVR